MNRINQLLNKQGQAGELFGDFTVQQNNQPEDTKGAQNQFSSDECIKQYSDDNSDLSKTEKKKRYVCSFCYKNRELSVVYTSHPCKDENGHTVCPILRNYVCNICGQTGDNAHTRRYCPFNMKEEGQYQPWFRRLSNGIITTDRSHK